MDLYNLPPLDMQLEPLRLSFNEQPGNRFLLGVALFAVCGLLISLFASAPAALARGSQDDVVAEAPLVATAPGALGRRPLSR